MVCYMYYTDVFVGSNNINENLKNALKAELKGSGLNDLDTQLKALASGLENFIGYSGGVLSGNGIGKSGGSYKSSYDSNNATWEKLCENCKCKKLFSNSSCSKCSCGSSGPSVCDPSQCCPDCDVRKAAKIFLGMLPCLYYALKYLKEKCEVDWKDQKISDNNHSLRHFLRGMGYDVTNDLKSSVQASEILKLLNDHIFNDSKGSLDKIYNVVKEKYFKFVSPSDSPSQPKTVRDILLWLSGLPFTSGFKDLLKHCKGLCSDIKDSSNPVKFNDFETSLFNSCFLSPFVLGVIEDHKEAFKNFPPYKSEISKFSYPSDPFDLFEALFKYIHKIYTPLTFLEYQCGKEKRDAGWKNCGYGQKCAEALQPFLSSATSSPCCPSSLPKGILCTGQPGEKDHAEHCTKVGVECMALGTCNPNGAHTQTTDKCDPCPHPLVRFLTDSWPFSQNYPDSFVPKMGFSKDSLPFPGRRGEALHTALKDFCDSGNSSSSLTTLLKFLTRVSRTPPETLGEFFVFFQKFPGALKNKLKTNFDSYVSKEPGRPDGQKFTTAFQTALEALKGSSNSHSNSGSHPYDLFSLNDCHVTEDAGEDVTCGPYLNSLTGDVYDIFIDNFDETYLSWICYLPKDFKNRLEEFKQKFSKCCLQDSSSSSSCTTIVNCPCAWPLISSQGFSFTSRGSLSGETSNKEARKCSDFIKQLEKVISGDLFTNLLAEIEKFLWSIRLPFFLFILAFWTFVISYFLYVQLYKLDLLHLKSHAHLPRSFKILPSTLFSDASSRLKDLSYFTL
ncbi:variant erythrocyte surface antigen-1 family protein [Babesia divergens]|uniref:Variant erythrocyte surface antigen-1 family protein n=1 Tax=Babesia divergens TaxID=32595 RepID=A0AAD9GB61_BABDI|nr:variant erythrocyte surface antigen-1 family protein [Babesia divergens]